MHATLICGSSGKGHMYHEKEVEICLKKGKSHDLHLVFGAFQFARFHLQLTSFFHSPLAA